MIIWRRIMRSCHTENIFLAIHGKLFLIEKLLNLRQLFDKHPSKFRAFKCFGNWRSASLSHQSLFMLAKAALAYLLNLLYLIKCTYFVICFLPLIYTELNFQNVRILLLTIKCCWTKTRSFDYLFYGLLYLQIWQLKLHWK